MELLAELTAVSRNGEVRSFLYAAQDRVDYVLFCATLQLPISKDMLPLSSVLVKKGSPGLFDKSLAQEYKDVPEYSGFSRAIDLSRQRLSRGDRQNSIHITSYATNKRIFSIPSCP